LSTPFRDTKPTAVASGWYELRVFGRTKALVTFMTNYYVIFALRETFPAENPVKFGWSSTFFLAGSRFFLFFPDHSVRTFHANIHNKRQETYEEETVLNHSTSWFRLVRVGAWPS
jgi:hypothetical protein